MVVKTYKPRKLRVVASKLNPYWPWDQERPFALWDGDELLRWFSSREEAEQDLYHRERMYNGFTSGDLKIG